MKSPRQPAPLVKSERHLGYDAGLGMVNSVKHYLREDVSREIVKFCSGRWVAVECLSRGGRRIFHRYWDGGAPLTIREPADIKRIINRLGRSVPRTIYGSLNIYRKLEARDDVSRRENILMTTPSWDIDGSLEEVDLIKEAAETILQALRRMGVEKSVYLIWSGRGIHIHVNERAISRGIWERDPLRVSFSIVEYVLRNVREDLRRICARSGKGDRRLKIENVVDVQRVFTAPLSLHRELDVVAVTIKPSDLEDFDLSWTNPEGFRYWSGWDGYEEGEADELALKALESIRGAERTRAEAEKPKARETSPLTPRPVGRFQVMALLQAARYYVLKGDLNLAKSFGLNRAIFYAWAKKRGVTTRRAVTHRRAGEAGRRREVEERIGDEVAFRLPGRWFVIGGQVQKPTDFDRQVALRFGKDFEKFWNAAIQYVKRFPREVLESQREFYERVYLPARDNPALILERGKASKRVDYETPR